MDNPQYIKRIIHQYVFMDSDMVSLLEQLRVFFTDCTPIFMDDIVIIWDNERNQYIATVYMVNP